MKPVKVSKISATVSKIAVF